MQSTIQSARTRRGQHPQAQHQPPSGTMCGPSEFDHDVEVMRGMLLSPDDANRAHMKQKMANLPGEMLLPFLRHLAKTLGGDPKIHQSAWEELLDISVDHVSNEYLSECLYHIAKEFTRANPHASAFITRILDTTSRITSPDEQHDTLRKLSDLLVKKVSPEHWVDAFVKAADGGENKSSILASMVLSNVTSSHTENRYPSRYLVALQELAINNAEDKQKIIVELCTISMPKHRYADSAYDCWKMLIDRTRHLQCPSQVKGGIFQNMLSLLSHTQYQNTDSVFDLISAVKKLDPAGQREFLNDLPSAISENSNSEIWMEALSMVSCLSDDEKMNFFKETFDRIDTQKNLRIQHAAIDLIDQLSEPKKHEAIRRLAKITKIKDVRFWTSLWDMAYTGSPNQGARFEALKIVFLHADKETRANCRADFIESLAKQLEYIATSSSRYRYSELKKLAHIAKKSSIFDTPIWLSLAHQLNEAQTGGYEKAVWILLNDDGNGKHIEYEKIARPMLSIVKNIKNPSLDLLSIAANAFAEAGYCKKQPVIAWTKEMITQIGIETRTQIHPSYIFDDKLDIQLWAAYSNMPSGMWRDLYLKILQTAATRSSSLRGKTLALVEIVEIKLHREEIINKIPAVCGNILSNPNDGENKKITQTRFCAYPELENACLELKSSAQALKDSLTLEKQAQQGRVARKKFSDAITACKTFIEQAFPPGGQDFFGPLIDSKKREIKIHINRAIEKILKLEETFPFQEKFEPLKKSFGDLLKIIGSDDFTSRYKNRDFYTIGLLDKDAAESLLLGHEVACCLSLTSKNEPFYGMLQRLIDPAWQPIVVRDSKGKPAAVAWAALCSDSSLPGHTSLVIDTCDMKPRYKVSTLLGGETVQNPLGELLLEQLISFVPKLATGLQLDGAWLGKQLYNGLAEFNALVGAKKFVEKPTLNILSASQPFAGVSAYTDQLQKFARFCDLLAPADSSLESSEKTLESVEQGSESDSDT